MRSDELIEAVRMGAFITSAGFPDYQDPRLLVELDNTLTQTFERAIIHARAGFWLQHAIVTVAAGRSKVRIPPRSVAGGLENVAVADAGSLYRKLEEISETAAFSWESDAQGTPIKFVVRGDQVELIPTPAAPVTVRMAYYIRPSRLVAHQGSPGMGLENAGRVMGVDPIARTITVNMVPYDANTGAPLPTGSAVDVVHPAGWHELALVGAVVTIIGNVLTLAAAETAPLDEIEVGDYVRAAEQSEWPALPVDFHRCLADLTAVKIMLQMHMDAKASSLMAEAQAVLGRFNDMLVPRVKSDAKALKAPRSVLQCGRGRM